MTSRRVSRSAKRRLRLAGAAFVVMIFTILALAVPVSPSPRADAGWGQSATATANFTANSLSPISSFRCDQSSGLLALFNYQVDWLPPTTGLQPTSYTVSWTGASTGSTTVMSSPTATSYTAQVSLPVLNITGNIVVTIQSNYAGWTSPTSKVTFSLGLVVLGINIGWSCA